MCVFQSKFSQQMNENHMASHLVRWWKTKFLNGYKQFTAVLPTDCSDGRPSDTEELLRPDSEEFVAQPNHHHQQQQQQQQQQRISHSTQQSSAPPHTTKPHSINNNNNNNHHHHHHHRTPSSTPPPSAKRELNFEEFQCDVSVEGTGSGSAEPNDRQEFSFTLYDFDGHGKITKDDIAGLVTTIYDTLGSSIRVPHYGSKTIKVKLTVSPDQIHNTTPDADKTSPTTEEGGGDGGPAPASPQQQTTTTPQQPPPPRRFKRDLNVTIRERRRRPPPPPHHHHHHHPTPHAARRRHSFSSSAPSEDREADISEDDDDVVGQQQHMQQQTPLPPSAHSRLGVPPHSHINSSRLGHPGTLPTSACCGRNKKRSSSLQRQELLQIIQANMEKNNLCFQTSRKPYSVSQENERHKMSHHNHYWEKGGATTRGHSRSRVKSSHETPPIIPPRPAPTSPAQAPPPSGPTAASSPHHLKHRHREQEQARAMAQVVRWLEQEFSTPHREKTHHKTTTTTERTEHHHIHEHVHHHYHHYQDTPVLV